jgi:hypothetical protein
MNNSDADAFSKLLDAVFPIYRMEASTGTKKLWWNLLLGYPITDVAHAFEEHLRTNKFAPTPADIVSIIGKLRPDGRLGADEAWAMIPRDEYKSVVMTDEMAEALRFAQPLLDEGDQVAARMAFKEAYTTIVDEHKRANTKPRWFPSLGQDKEGRESVLAEAVRLGRLSAEQAMGLLPPEKIVQMLESAGRNDLALEHKPSDEIALANIEKMKALLNGHD